MTVSIGQHSSADRVTMVHFGMRQHGTVHYHGEYRPSSLPRRFFQIQLQI